ncbi:MAG: ribulose 1,5-bisphosphate carboxylase large subunit [Spirochaetales bacterium]|nr:ribulose 1,5-bisphosphate carboxylase large subunit [Spirochaetales bacterium]
MIPQGQKLELSGERFVVDYVLKVSAEEALMMATNLCYEQTVEFPADLVPEGDIKEKIVGRIERIEEVDESHQKVSISFAVELTGFQFVQFLNVIFGNCSLFPGVRIVGLDLPEILLKHFKGPRFGREGLRELFAAEGRPLITTAIKPQGMSAGELADQTSQFALGGIDIIKDDHGLCDQPFSPFYERVKLCSEAVNEANAKTGFKSIYMPSISGPSDKILDWAHYAKEAGAGGLMLSAGLVGWDMLKRIAEDDSLGLPLMSHPSFLGSYVTSPDNGFSHGVLYGTLARMAGADLSVYPNYGGRFSFSKDECTEIARATAAELGGLNDCFPAPGGGMTLDRIPEIVDFYGGEVALLVGGGLHRGEGTLTESCLELRKLVSKAAG